MRRVIPQAEWDALLTRQDLDRVIESLERDLDRRCWSFSETMSLMDRLRRLRRLRDNLRFDEGEEREEESSPVG